MIKKVLVTGANSMLGLNTVQMLMLHGYKVRALVRRSNKVLDNWNPEIVFGNVTAYDDVLRAADGCDAIIHIAATTDQNQPSLRFYNDINVSATQNVCKAAINTSARRVVIVSTSNTIGNGTLKLHADETFIPAKPFSDNLYARSKIIAEQQALNSGADVVIVNPTFMLGKYDTKPSSGYIIKMYYRKKILIIPKGGKNFVAATDVAQLLISAMEHGEIGQRYLAAGVNMSFKDFFKMLANYQKKKPYIITMPSWMLITVGYVGSSLRALGFKTSVCACNMKILTTQEFYTPQKAINMLNMPQTPISQALKACTDWMLANKIIKQ